MPPPTTTPPTGNSKNVNSIAKDSGPSRPVERVDPIDPAARRWLHAGLYRDASGIVYDVFFTFKLSGLAEGHCRIAYAADKEGTPFENYNAGASKIDLITWDEHFEAQWADFMDPDTRSWKVGLKRAGEEARRKVLYTAYKNAAFVDPYPDGKKDGSGMRPPVNMIFPSKNSTPAFDINDAEVEVDGGKNTALCFPGTHILVSDTSIRKNSWREESKDPKEVIKDFMLGRLSACAAKMPGLAKPIDHIESAFFTLGYRIDLEATKKASREASAGKMCIWETKTWREALPYRVGDSVDEDYRLLLETLREQVMEQRRATRPENKIPADGNQNLSVPSAASGNIATNRNDINNLRDNLSKTSSRLDNSITKTPANLPSAYSSNTTFPNSRIECSPNRIQINAWKTYSRHATLVVSDFLNGILAIGSSHYPGEFSSLAIIESAFYKCGFRIDIKAAMDASKAVRDHEAESVLDVEAWKTYPPIKLQPGRYSRIDGLLRGVQLEPSLFVDDSSDEERERNCGADDEDSSHLLEANALDLIQISRNDLIDPADQEDIEFCRGVQYIAIARVVFNLQGPGLDLPGEVLKIALWNGTNRSFLGQ